MTMRDDPAQTSVDLVADAVQAARTSTEKGFLEFACMLIAKARRDFYATLDELGHRLH